jgi:hypothetical protein
VALPRHAGCVLASLDPALAIGAPGILEWTLETADFDLTRSAHPICQRVGLDGRRQGNGCAGRREKQRLSGLGVVRQCLQGLFLPDGA